MCLMLALPFTPQLMVVACEGHVTGFLLALLQCRMGYKQLRFSHPAAFLSAHSPVLTLFDCSWVKAHLCPQLSHCAEDSVTELDHSPFCFGWCQSPSPGLEVQREDPTLQRATWELLLAFK